jgi:hypothetical protein
MDAGMLLFYEKKQWWSTIPPTKWTIISHLKSLNMKKVMTYGIGYPGPIVGQAQKCVILNPHPLDEWIS